jgi:hypothetical protein
LFAASILLVSQWCVVPDGFSPTDKLIDGLRVGCQDIDEALRARLPPNGNIEAGVREFIFFPLFSSLPIVRCTDIADVILSTPTHQWTARLPREEQQYT